MYRKFVDANKSVIIIHRRTSSLKCHYYELMKIDI